MKKPINVFKFGGASLKDADSVRNVGRILKQYGSNQLLIVVSAMGKTTNALEKVVWAHAEQNGEAENHFREVRERHFELLGQLFEPGDPVFAEVNDAFVEIEWVIEEEPHHDTDYMYDQVVSVGELVSSRIVCAYLNQIGLSTSWLDARDVILTDNVYREGRVEWPETVENALREAKPKVEENGFVITQGFIGGTTENFTTTLGREGSDYTAAIFSFCLDAESMTIWKDVPGVLTADPRLFEHVTKVDRLSYKEAIEMTYYGAKVIHPKTIKPLQNKSIPLYVKSFVDPEGSGTYISDEVIDTYPPMVAVVKDQALLQISTRDFSFVAEHHMSYLFGLIADLRIQVNMMQNTAISFVVCITNHEEKLEKFSKMIEEKFKLIVDQGLELITVRHYHQPLLDNLKSGKVVMLEERLPKTIQMVVKDVPVMRRKN